MPATLNELQQAAAERINAMSTAQRQLNWRDLQAAIEVAQQLVALNFHLDRIACGIEALADLAAPAAGTGKDAGGK